MHIMVRPTSELHTVCDQKAAQRSESKVFITGVEHTVFTALFLVPAILNGFLENLVSAAHTYFRSFIY
jgi:hypothetical protein